MWRRTLKGFVLFGCHLNYPFYVCKLTLEFCVLLYAAERSRHRLRRGGVKSKNKAKIQQNWRLMRDRTAWFVWQFDVERWLILKLKPILTFKLKMETFQRWPNHTKVRILTPKQSCSTVKLTAQEQTPQTQAKLTICTYFPLMHTFTSAPDPFGQSRKKLHQGEART